LLKGRSSGVPDIAKRVTFHLRSRRGKAGHGVAKCATQHLLAFFGALPRFCRAPTVEDFAEVADRDINRGHEIDFDMVGSGGRVSVGAEIEYLRGHALLHESHSRQNVFHRLMSGVGHHGKAFSRVVSNATRSPPRLAIMARSATAMPAQIKPYSMAVAPDSSVRNPFIVKSMKPSR
jgi:hypothetical protein